MEEYQGKTLDVLIVGSGPAGLTASLYAARADLSPLVIEGPEPGGQLTQTTDVENYLGYPEGVLGPKMMEDFREQARRFGAHCRYGFVTEIDFDQHPYKLTVDERTQLLAKAIIISTGASAKWLNLPNATRLKCKGLSACATCDGAFFREQPSLLWEVEILRWRTLHS
jgi:Thioredoxin reductase